MLPAPATPPIAAAGPVSGRVWPSLESGDALGVSLGVASGVSVASVPPPPPPPPSPGVSLGDGDGLSLGLTDGLSLGLDESLGLGDGLAVAVVVGQGVAVLHWQFWLPWPPAKAVPLPAASVNTTAIGSTARSLVEV